MTKVDVSPAALGGRGVHQVAEEAMQSVAFPVRAILRNEGERPVVLGEVGAVARGGEASEPFVVGDRDLFARVLTDAAWLAESLGLPLVIEVEPAA